ncbi:MAG: DUF3108 domain-containing protein [Gemmatimonadaceae bacterium]
MLFAPASRVRLATPWRRTVGARLMRCALAVSAWAPSAAAQEPTLPFRPGEALEYQVQIHHLGTVGHGRMWVEGPSVDRSVPTWLLHLDVSAGTGPLGMQGHTTSWLDPVRFGITRFEKQERRFMRTAQERVTILDQPRRWVDVMGPAGMLGPEPPLDELSFLYFLRTLPLTSDSILRFERHFDAARNPVLIRNLGMARIETPVGRFRAHLIEMEVRDPKHYDGAGIVRVYFDEGRCHVPLRIESRVPLVGVTVMVLESWSQVTRQPNGAFC